MRRRGALRPRDRLPQRRHRGVPARPGGQLRLHRDEPAHPGRAHRDRGGHRRRPRAGPAAHRLGREPGRPGALAGHAGAARRGPAVPDHDRGPGQRLPSRHRADHHLPLAGRRRGAPRRRHRLHRRRGLGPLRLDAGQAHLPGPDLRQGRREGTTRRGRVPHPRRGHQHPVPPGRARRPRLRGRAGHHLLHRDPPRAALGARLGRPRHQAADLPRRGDRQPAARPRPGQPRPGPQAAADRPRGAGARRQPPGAAAPGPRGLRAPAARAARGGRHRHHLP